MSGEVWHAEVGFGEICCGEYWAINVGFVWERLSVKGKYNDNLTKNYILVRPNR